MKNVLVITQQSEIVKRLRKTGQGEFVVKCAVGLAEAMKEIESIDLIILDLDIGGLGGWELARILKKDEKSCNIPAIMVTSKYTDVKDIVKGLEAGADDYVKKSIHSELLLARIKAILRRTGYEEEILKSGSILLNLTTHTVLVAQKPVRLTPKEFALLRVLMQEKEKLFGRRALYERIWGEKYSPASTTIDKHIETLRKKLGSEGKHIQTISGLGYKFSNQ